MYRAHQGCQCVIGQVSLHSSGGSDREKIHLVLKPGFYVSAIGGLPNLLVLSNKLTSQTFSGGAVNVNFT
jgi:hypothetical protein